MIFCGKASNAHSSESRPTNQNHLVSQSVVNNIQSNLNRNAKQMHVFVKKVYLNSLLTSFLAELNVSKRLLAIEPAEKGTKGVKGSGFVLDL